MSAPAESNDPLTAPLSMFINIGGVAYQNPKSPNVVGENKIPQTEYQLMAALDRSQDATIFKAIDTTGHQKLAVKILAEGESKDRIQSGINHQIGVSSNSILQVLTGMQNDLYAFYVFPYCQNGDLYHYILENGPITNSKLLKNVLYSIALSVKHLHDESIIHNHIRPQSILLSDFFDVHKLDEEKPQTLLSGFGHAMSETEASSGINFPISENDDFIAPEFKKSKVPTYATDIYSLGVTFYMIVIGYSPTYVLTSKTFQEDHQINQNNRCSDLRFNEMLWLNINYHLCGLVKEMMSSDPTKRFTIDQVVSNPYFDSIKDTKLDTPAYAEILQSTHDEYLDNLSDKDEEEEEAVFQ